MARRDGLQKSSRAGLTPLGRLSPIPRKRKASLIWWWSEVSDNEVSDIFQHSAVGNATYKVSACYQYSGKTQQNRLASRAEKCTKFIANSFYFFF